MPGKTIPNKAFSNQLTNGGHPFAYQWSPATIPALVNPPSLPAGAHWTGPNNALTRIKTR
jgi:hypothetical protein